MQQRILTIGLFFWILQSCATNKGPTLADILVEPVDLELEQTVEVKQESVIESYKKLVELQPKTASRGKEVQRLADLELEASLDKRLSDDPTVARQGMEESNSAIERYQIYLQSYPGRADNDKVLYQLSRAHTLNNEPEQSYEVMTRLVKEFPNSRFTDEIQFRRGEYLFVEEKFKDASEAYGVVVARYPSSTYYEKSLYKYAWTLFKLNQIDAAINHYIQLLDFKQKKGYLREMSISPNVTRAERELLDDVLRVISLSFSYHPSEDPIQTSLEQFGERPYEALLYRTLGDLFMRKERISDATDVFLRFTKIHPDSKHTPEFHSWAIEGYKRGGLGFVSLILPQLESFVDRYAPGSRYWKSQKSSTRARIQPLLTGYMEEIATHYHSLASKQKKPDLYQRTIKEYRRFLDAFPRDEKAPKMNFLLAEVLFETGQYAEAADEYERVAYDYSEHDKSREAGYASLFSYSKLYDTATEKQVKIDANSRLSQSLLKYYDRFSFDERIPTLLLASAENFFSLGEYRDAVRSAQSLVLDRTLKPDMQQKAWVIMAHGNFEIQNFQAAEQAYREAIRFIDLKSPQRKDLIQQLASSIYKQGEQERKLGNHQVAADHFLRVRRMVPESDLVIIADYDAATEYIAMKNWVTAIQLLEQFRQLYPNDKQFELGVTEKLALAYSKEGMDGPAADEILALVALVPPEKKQDMLWQAANLFEESGNQKKAMESFIRYVNQYPQPVARAIEVRHKIATHYADKSQQAEHRKWLQSIVDADAKAGDQRTDRSRYLAATALMQLTQSRREAYREAHLTIPLKKSLSRKKQLMQQNIEAYKQAAGYQVAEVTTRATFEIAEIYREFAQALLKSERPKNLNQEELEEYNYLLEDQAFPFEEKALEIHQSNISKIPKGLYDEAIKNSLEALGKLMPFRYAKNEVMDAYVDFKP